MKATTILLLAVLSASSSAWGQAKGERTSRADRAEKPDRPDRPAPGERRTSWRFDTIFIEVPDRSRPGAEKPNLGPGNRVSDGLNSATASSPPPPPPPAPISTTPVDISTIGRSSIPGVPPPPPPPDQAVTLKFPRMSPVPPPSPDFPESPHAEMAAHVRLSQQQRRTEALERQRQLDQIVSAREERAQRLHMEYSAAYDRYRKHEISTNQLYQALRRWTDAEALAAQPVD